MIKNIIFDIGGVLVDFDPVLVLKQMGLPKNEVQTIAEKTVLGPYWKELDRGVLPKEQVFSMMIAEVPEPYKNNARDFLFNHTLETVKSFDYSANWLKNLKERGYKVFLLTNYPSWMFNAHWEKVFTFSNFVDGKLVSAEEKLIKPDEAIYECILNRFNLTATECVFIDDRLENVQAAEKRGINGIHFTNITETMANLEKCLNNSDC
ncbi:MAG: HAD family phosphatase [Treponema sp.]|nr:HAD family phosphatase [Treponema sp.]